MLSFRNLIAMLALLLLAPLSSSISAADDVAPGKTLAVFELSGPVTEIPLPDDPIFGSIGGESLRALTGRMHKAAEDDDIAGVVVLVGEMSLGNAQLEEVRAAIDTIRKSGKPIYTHVHAMSTWTFALLAGTTRISVVPTGDVMITGVYGEQMFIRGLLDKVGVQPDFLTCGEYKAAGEMFTRTEPSPEAKQNYDWLFDSMYNRVVQLIATGRSVPEEKAKAWIDEGLFSAEEALADGLVDAVEHHDQFVAFLKEKHGANLKFEKSYAQAKGQTIDLNNPFAAFQLWGQILAGPQTRRSNKDAIAIVHIDGAIMAGESQPSLFSMSEGGAFSEPLRKALEKAAADDKIKAVVLRVNSPGGSAVASEIILQAAKQVAAKKPLVVSMGDVAASGGYYVSCAAERIFADATTLTGSIGVVSGKLATGKMWNEIGVNFRPIQRGAKSGLLSSANVFTEEERKEMQTYMDDVYGVFKNHVTNIRGDRLKKPIDDIAGGRVYTGQQALELGLVDEIGGLGEAITYVAGKANLKEGSYEIRILPRPTNALETLFADISGSGEKADDKTLSLPHSPRFGTSSIRRSLTGTKSSGLLDAALPLLEGLDPRRVRLVRQALLQLELLQGENVLLTSPLVDIPTR